VSGGKLMGLSEVVAKTLAAALGAVQLCATSPF